MQPPKATPVPTTARNGPSNLPASITLPQIRAHENPIRTKSMKSRKSKHLAIQFCEMKSLLVVNSAGPLANLFRQPPTLAFMRPLLTALFPVEPF